MRLGAWFATTAVLYAIGGVATAIYAANQASPGNVAGALNTDPNTYLMTALTWPVYLYEQAKRAAIQKAITADVTNETTATPDDTSSSEEGVNG